MLRHKQAQSLCVTPSVCRLLTEVKAAQEEANENATLLKPMRKLFERLRDLDDFTVIPTLFRPVMHLLLLVWTHGRHYNTATRFVTLMRLICNDVMQQARRFAPGEMPSKRKAGLRGWELPGSACSMSTARMWIRMLATPMRGAG